MPSKRKKRRITQIKQEKVLISKRFVLPIIVSIFLIISLVGVIYYFIYTSIDQSSYSVAVKSSEGDYIKVYDIKNSYVTKISFPTNTYVNAGLGRGNWRLESIHKMIETEKLSNQMYADTVMKTFDVPIDGWSVNGNTNYNLFQKIKLFLIGFSSKSVEIDLAETSYLSPKKLPDGENGYVPANDLPTTIRQAFADVDFASNGYRVEIERYISRNYSSATDLIDVLTTMGAHVVNVKREEARDINCEIQSKPNVDIDRIANIFDCNKSLITEGNLDIRIKIGNKFASRF